MIRALGRFGRFWYDFVVGDDWTIAIGVVVALGLIFALAQAGFHATWWLLPLVVAGGLGFSAWRAARHSGPGPK